MSWDGEERKEGTVEDSPKEQSRAEARRGDPHLSQEQMARNGGSLDQRASLPDPCLPSSKV